MTVPKKHTPSGDFSAQVDAACDALESAWQQGAAPDWRDFIAGNCTDEHQLCCAELIAVDMEWRQKAQLPVRAEDYLADLPGEPSAAIQASIVGHEFELRQRRGDQFGPDEYFRRFPELSGVLSTMFPKDASTSNLNSKPSRLGKRMKPTADEFSERLTDSGILNAEQVDKLRQATGLTAANASAETLAKLLVKKGQLTKFQAQLAYNDKTQKLVMGSYVILEKLGEGGMGQVFKARHKRMKREVALKVLAPQFVKDDGALQRFHREVEAAARLNHPNIVTAHDANETNGTHYLVMELVSGTDLSELVKKTGPLPVSKAVDCVLQAAKGLAYAHGQNVVHRDIKPANLLLDEDGTVKILDMGLARFDEIGNVDIAGAALTGTGMLMGTVDYMAPEQALDSKTADHRADIYSLGCTLYYLLTGKPMYSADTVMKRVMAHQNAALPKLPVDDEDLQKLFERMVAKKVEDRIEPAQVVVAALEAWQNTSVGDTTQPVQSAAVDTATAPDDEQHSGASAVNDQSDSQSAETVLQASIPADTGQSTDSSAFEATIVPSKSSDIAANEDKTKPLAVAESATGNGRKKNNGKLFSAGAGGLAAILLLGAIMFRFTGRDGTVVVELKGDPKVTAVEINSREVSFTPAGADKQVTFKVNAGSHTLAIKTADGLELTTTLGEKPLKIKAGGNTRLSAWVEQTRKEVIPIIDVPTSDEGILALLGLSKTMEWSEPSRMSGTINSDVWDAWPALSTDGLSIAFTSSREHTGKDAPSDLYVSTRGSLVDDWGEARNIGKNANPGQHKWGTAFSGDSKTLWFIARDWDDTRRLMTSTFDTSSGKWLDAQAADPPLGSARDQEVYISRDHTEFYLRSDRSGGNQIYRFLFPDGKSPLQQVDLSCSTVELSPYFPQRPLFQSKDGKAMVFSGAGDMSHVVAFRQDRDQPWSNPRTIDSICRGRKAWGTTYAEEAGNLIVFCRGDDLYEMRLIPKAASDISDLTTKAQPAPTDPVVAKFPRPEYDPSPLPKLGTWEPVGTAEIGTQFPDGRIGTADTLPGLALMPAKLEGVKRWNVDTRLPRGPVTHAQYSAKADLLAVGSRDGSVRIFDAKAMTPRQFLPGFDFEPINDVSWRADGEAILATGGSSLRVWALDGTMISEQHFGHTTSGCFSPDGSIIATATGNGLKLQSAATGDIQVSHTFAHDQSIPHKGNISWSPDSQQFATLHYGSKVRIWNRKGEQVGEADGFKNLHYRGHSIQWSPNGRSIAVNTMEHMKEIILLSADGKQRRTIRSKSDIHRFKWMPDGEHIVLFPSLTSIAVTTGTESKRLTNETFFQSPSADGDVAINKDGDLFASAYSLLSKHLRDGNLQVPHKFPRSVFPIENLRWSRDGEYFAVKTIIGNVNFADAFGTPIGNWRLGGSVYSLMHWHPRNAKIALTIEQSPTLFDHFLSAAPAKLDSSPNPNQYWAIDWNADGRFLAAGRTGHVDIFDENGQLLGTMKCSDEERGAGVAWHPTVDLLAVVCGNDLYTCNPQDGWELKSQKRELKSQNRKDGEANGDIRWNVLGTQLSVTNLGAFDFDGSRFTERGPRYMGDVPGVRDYSPHNNQILLRNHSGIQRFDGVAEKPVHQAIPNIAREYGAISWHPRRDLALISDMNSSILAWDLREWRPYWRHVLLPDEQTVTLTAAGQIVNGDREAVNKYLVYYIENDDGRIEVLTPTEFETRIGQSLYIPEPPTPLVGKTLKAAEQDTPQPRTALGIDERKELLNLLRSVIRVDTGRMAQVNAIDGFLKTPSTEKWRGVRKQATDNTTKLRKVIAQIEELNGDFIVDEMDTYRELMIDLDSKAKVYEELLEIDDKMALTVTESIKTLAGQHSALIIKLQSHEAAIQKYLQSNK